jgi:hypothetical protein
MIRQNLRTWLLKPWMLVVLDGTAYGQDFTNNGGTITAQYSNPNGVENYPKLIDNDVTTKYYIIISLPYGFSISLLQRWLLRSTISPHGNHRCFRSEACYVHH